MTNVDPRAAAEKLKSEWEKDPPNSPSDRHQAAFLEQVCGHLGIEANSINVSHAARLMERLGLGQHHPAEYPKMLVTKDTLGRQVNVVYPNGHPQAGVPVVLHSAEEEDAYHANASK